MALGYTCFLVSRAMVAGAVLWKWIPPDTWAYTGVDWLMMGSPGVPDPVIAAYTLIYLGLSIGGPLRWVLVYRRRILRRNPPHAESEWLEPE